MTPTFTSCADAACVMAMAAATAVAATAAIIRLDIKNPPRFPEISVDFSGQRAECDSRAKAGNGASEVRPRRCGSSSRKAGALLLRSLIGGLFHNGLDSDRDRRHRCPRPGRCRADAGRLGA